MKFLVKSQWVKSFNLFLKLVNIKNRLKKWAIQKVKNNGRLREPPLKNSIEKILNNRKNIKRIKIKKFNTKLVSYV